MNVESDPLAVLDASLERQQRQVDAKFKLLDMDNFETLARNCETKDVGEGIDETETAVRLAAWSNLYEETVGVPLQLRHQFRALLDEIVATGERTVQRAIERVMSQSRNGVFLAGRFGADGILAEDWT